MQQEKYEIVSRLLNDENPRDIANLLDVSHSKVLRYKRELTEHLHNNTLNEFIDLDAAMLNELTTLARSRVPTALESDASEVLDTLVSVKSTLDALSLELQSTAKFLSSRIKVTASTTTTTSELETLSVALCNLQNAFFNKNSTQVNVQNNYSAEQGKYGNLLNDKPTDY